MQEKQNKENNDPGDTVIWGVNGEQRPSEEAVKEINRYLKKSGHDFKVKFTSVWKVIRINSREVSGD